MNKNTNVLFTKNKQTVENKKLVNLIALVQSGKLSEAERMSKKLLKKLPRSPAIINILAASLVGQGKFKKALHAYNKILEINPKHAETYFNRGIVFQNLNRFEDSIDSYNHATDLKPNHSQAILNRGHAFQSLKKYESALENYNQVITLEPNLSDGNYNKGVVLQQLGKYEESVDSYNQSINLNPNHYQSFNNKGFSLQKIGKFKQALKAYNQAISLKPDYFEAYYNKAIVLEDLGEIDRAISSYKKALEIKKDDVEVRWNLSLLLILTGDLKKGWKEYEYGKLTIKRDRNVAQTPFASWNGENLSEKTILITTEQGIGDEIMFSSCIPDIFKQKPKKVIVECDKRISNLFKTSFKSIHCVNRKNRSLEEWKGVANNIDYQISIGSLPHFFRQDLSQFPSRKSFLLPNKHLVGKWKKRYNLLGNGLKIGISWLGGISDIQRSIALNNWTKILKLKAHFINLQYGDCGDEIKQLKKQYNIHINDWDDSDPLSDLDNFAAQISELDLVISVDNSTVHFSGALGVPTWVMLPLTSNYRWMLKRDDTPWYPTLKLFRKNQSTDWDDVFSAIESELKAISAN